MKLKEVIILIRLWKLRRDRGITQKQLAEIIHVSQQSISAYEIGRAFPPMDTIVSLAGFFQVSIDFLLGGVKIYPEEFHEVVPYMLANDEKMIIDAYRGLSISSKNIVRRIADTCYENENEKEGRILS